MLHKKLINNSFKYLMIASLLVGFSSGLVANDIAEAAELSPEVVQLLGNTNAQNSAITYVSNGREEVLPVPVGQVIELRGHANKIDVKINKKTTSLKNVTDITFKGITVSNLIPFYTDSVTKMTLDNVNFQRGIDISGTKGLQALLVKDSTFGATDYSLAVHVAPQLTSLVIDNSSFNADVRIYSNHALANSSISNSVFKDDVKQYSNQRGYNTNFYNNRFEYGKKRTISSGGMNANDIFHVNPGDLAQIGTSRFDSSQAGKVIYKMADGVAKTLAVPAGVKITTVNDVGNKITIKLSNGESLVLNDTKSLTFYNVDINTHVAFTQKGLLLEKLEFINSRTRLIDVAYSHTLQSFKLNRSEVSQSTGYVSVYNNKAIKEFVMQESVVTGSSGYISVYNNTTLEDFIMNNTYTYGYLSAYNLGSSVLELSNAQYDDYINTNQIIEGEAEHVVVGDAPVIEAIPGKTVPLYGSFILANFVTATDTEDGVIDNINILEGSVNVFARGEYRLLVAATDSDDNTTTKEVFITVK